MKKRTLKSCFFIFLITITTSCTKVIDITIPNAGNRMVIEASIDWKKGTSGAKQTVKLSTSTGYFNNNPNIPITGANVKIIKDDNGMVFNFTDQNNGIYTVSNFVPEIGKSYTLNIVYNGKTYMANETLTSVNTINRVEQEDGFNDDAYRIKVFFDDPKEEINYYFGEFSQNNLKRPSLKVVDDKFTNGNESFILHFDKLNTLNTKIEIKVFGISKKFYNYMDLLIEQSNSSGNPFQTIPAKLTGNCKNINNPKEEVLGYFRLSQFTEVNYTIQ